MRGLSRRRARIGRRDMQWGRVITYLLGRYWQMQALRAERVADQRLQRWIAARAGAQLRARDAWMRTVGRRNACLRRAEKYFDMIGLGRGE